MNIRKRSGEVCKIRRTGSCEECKRKGRNGFVRYVKEKV